MNPIDPTRCAASANPYLQDNWGILNTPTTSTRHPTTPFSFIPSLLTPNSLPPFTTSTFHASPSTTPSTPIRKATKCCSDNGENIDPNGRYALLAYFPPIAEVREDQAMRSRDLLSFVGHTRISTGSLGNFAAGQSTGF
jgi:hypothetical protein